MALRWERRKVSHLAVVTARRLVELLSGQLAKRTVMVLAISSGCLQERP